MASRSGSNVGSARGFIREYVRRGLSSNKAYEEFHAAGGRMRQSYFRTAFNEVRDAMARSTEIAGLRGDRRPDADQFQTWSTRRPGRYVYQGTYFARERGSDVLTEGQFTIDYDCTVSINKAIRDMMAKLDQGAEGSEEYGAEVIESMTITGLYRTVPLA